MNEQDEQKPKVMLTDDGELVLPRKKKKRFSRFNVRLTLSIVILIFVGILVGILAERNIVTAPVVNGNSAYISVTSTPRPTPFPEGTLSADQIRIIATAHGTNGVPAGINETRVSKTIVLYGDNFSYGFSGLSGTLIGAARQFELSSTGAVSKCVAFIIRGPLSNDYGVRLIDGYWLENWDNVSAEDSEALFQTAVDYVKAHCDSPVKIMRLN